MDFSPLQIPTVSLEPSFSAFSAWRSYEVPGHGITYSVPPTFRPPADLPPHTYPSFALDEGQVTVLEIELPGSLFPNGNLSRGIFSIYANPRSETEPSCEDFGQLLNATAVQQEQIAGRNYTSVREFEGFTVHRHDYYRFHTWGRRSCYEVQVVFQAVDPSNADRGCTIPVVGESQERFIVDALIARVFFADDGRN